MIKTTGFHMITVNPPKSNGYLWVPSTWNYWNDFNKYEYINYSPFFIPGSFRHFPARRGGEMIANRLFRQNQNKWRSSRYK